MGVALGGSLGGKGGGGEALGCLWGLSDFFGLGGKGGAATAEIKIKIFSYVKLETQSFLPILTGFYVKLILTSS